MGEVRVRVVVTNFADEVLVDEGQLSPDRVRTYVADALVDMGAVRCVIPLPIAQQLGLRPINEIPVTYADGRTEYRQISNAFNIEIMGRREIETAVILGNEFMVGQTALEKMDYMVDCKEQRLVPKHPEGQLNRI